ncbi:hypothetical protein [Halorussus pelagicus]|uniref:hypothetical protein n=1 Tax=Halorussus pelagicus TaxID=2505977 RepID=UPI000FFB6009|nr:hypothetical protein [Halorussus pelagicus]
MLVGLLLASAVAPHLLAGTAAASATPDMPPGFVAIPDQNVEQGTPASDSFPFRASNMTGGDVLASDHAATTEFILTSPEDAEQTLGPDATVAEGVGNLAIVIRDDSVHDGRRIAINASEVRDEFGYLPDQIEGVHEDGSRWSEPVTTSSGYIVVEIPKFSDNVITFTGEVSLSGNPATDGSSYQYQLQSLDSASDFDINLTGVETTAWSNESGSLSPGDSASISVGGNLAPSGPAGGEPELTVTGQQPIQRSNWGDDGQKAINEGGNTTVATFSSPPSNLARASIQVESHISDGSSYFEGYAVTNGNWYYLGSVNFDGMGATTFSSSLSDVPTGEDVQFVLSGTQSGSDIWVQDIEIRGPAPKNVDVAFSDGTTASLGDFSGGETKTRAVDLSAGVSSLDTSGSHGSLDWSLSAEERIETESPTVEVNGNETSYPGRLSVGETVSLSTDSAWLQSGENTVTVSTAAGSVGLDYSHSARDDQSVKYEGESWSERYNVSKTWGDMSENATLEIPFAGNVVSNRDLTVYINGTKTAPTWSHFKSNTTTLKVGLGDLSPGTTTRVVADGSKVRVRNGAIRVTDPTTEGNALNTTFEVVSRGEEFRIDVSGTASSEWVHYLADPSYQNASASARIADGGASQYVRVPNAPEGGSATVRTLDLRADPQNDVVVSVADPDEPRFRIRQGTVAGDSVGLDYYGGESGASYDLVSESNGRVEDPSVSGSPVAFSLDSDESNLLRIAVADSGGSSSDDGGGGTLPLETAKTVASDPLANPLLVLGAGAVVILGVGLLARRRGVPIWASGGVLGLVFVVALESLAPRVLSGAFARVVEELAAGLGGVSRFLWLAGGLVGLWGVFRLVRKFTSPDRTILRIRGGK